MGGKDPTTFASLNLNYSMLRGSNGLGNGSAAGHISRSAGAGLSGFHLDGGALHSESGGDAV